MKCIFRVICMAIATVLVFGLLASILPTTAKAATGTLKLDELLTAGTIKPLGRTQVTKTEGGNGITADWSGNGFEINVSGGGTFTVGYESSRTNYVAVHVDGKQINANGTWAGSGVIDVKNANIACSKGTGSFTVTLPEGEGVRKVSVFRENGLTMNGADYFRFTTLAFDGEIAGRPDDKELFIEVIGDSIGTGSGTIGVYQAGIEWLDADHSAQSSFGWLLSKELGADLSITARGGSGLLTPAEKAQFADDGSNAGENIDTQVNSSMLHIYPYASGHHQEEGLYTYDPATDRKPDLVVLELGANDSLDYDKPAKTALWRDRLEDMIKLVRETYNDPNLKFLLFYQSPIPYAQMLDVADKDDNIYSCHYYFHGNGSVAKETQLSGHPDASDHELIAEAMLNCIKEQDILGLHGEVVEEPTYTDLEYYVSENGNDANDGTSIEAAKLTLQGALNQAKADHTSKLPAGTRIMVYVEGTVLTRSADHQAFDHGNAFLVDGGTVRDHIPVVLTTYNYTDTPATIQVNCAPTSDAKGSVRVVNDLEFRNINIYSETSEDGYCAHELYAAGCTLTFDNATLTTDGKGSTEGEDNTKWVVSADYYDLNGFNPTNSTFLPLFGNIVFRNGDYRHLNYVTAVNTDSITSGGETHTSLPQVNCTVKIEDGAKMGTVYGVHGTMGVETATVELNGGTVENYLPTLDAKTYNTDLTTIFNGGSIQNAKYFGTGNDITFNGNVTNEFRKGRFSGQVFAGLGSNVTLTGNLTNKISGGEIRVEPQAADDGIFLAGYKNVTITGNVINNITSGDLNLLFRDQEVVVSSGIYLGLRSGKINGDLTNTISGGNLFAASYVDPAKYTAANKTPAGIHLAMTSGDITGTLTNHITAGTFDGEAADCDRINFGTQANNGLIGKMVSVIGEKDDPKHGPRFVGSVLLGSDRNQVGKAFGKTIPDADDCSSDVVIETTIYSGVFGQTFAAPYRAPSGTRCPGVIGGVKTNIYGGRFAGRFYGTGSAPVCGHVTTNIYGGYFTGIYGAYTGAVYDGVETNIYNFTEFYNAYLTVDSNPCKIYAGGAATQISTVTAGRDPVKLTLDLPADKRLITPVYAGFATGGTASKVKVELQNGILPNIYSSAEGETFAGSVELVVSGGKVEQLVPVSSGATISGGVTCTVSGGTVESYVGTASGTAEAPVTCTTNLTTTVSGGNVNSYMGTGDYVNFTGNLTNNVSDGQLYCRAGEATTYTYPTIHFGMYSGHIAGDLVNNISGGTFDTTDKGYYYFGHRAVNSSSHRILNTIGDPADGTGPAFNGKRTVYLGNNWGRIDPAGDQNAMPDETTDCTDTVVMRNIIYGGTFTSSVVAGSNSTPDLSKARYAYIKGSVENTVYGGTFTNFFGNYKTPVYGNATTDIYGGTFSTIYGTYSGTVYDYVELNILGLDEGCKTSIYGAGNSATVGSAQTNGPAVKLTISHNGEFSKTIAVKATATINGDAFVAVSAGTYTEGFKVNGVTVKEALAEGYSLLDTETGALIPVDDDATSSGTTSVTVGRPIADNLEFTKASVVLNTDLGINFKLPSTFLDGGYSAPYAVFKLGDTETVVNSYSVTGDLATFKFRNIAPHRIGDTVTATLYATKDGVLYTSKTTEYSIKKYCDNKLSAEDSSDALRKLLVDLLNYGALSQQYVDNSIAADKLVNCGLTDEQKAWGSTGTPTLENITAQTTLENATVTWKATGLYLEKSVDLRLKFYAESTDGLSVKFTTGGKTYTVTDFTPVSGQDNCYYVYFTRLNAGQMRQAVEATVYQNGVAVSNTLTYSVESYAAKHQNDATPLYLADLVKAMMLYGDSAAAYVE